METKTCLRCGINLPPTSFKPCKTGKNGLHPWCKACVTIYNRLRYTPRTPKPKDPIKIARTEKRKEKEILSSQGLRKCTKCKKIKPETSEFFNRKKQNRTGLNPWCKSCQYIYWLSTGGKERSLAYSKTPEARRKAADRAKKLNQDPTFRAIKNAKVRQKRKNSPIFRITENIRRSVSGAIKSNNFRKGSKLSEYLGCNFQEFKVYIETLWQPGMTWENYGYGDLQWNLDHTIPLVTALTVEELYNLNHFTNIRPMWQIYNFIKRDMAPSDWSAYKITNNIDESIPPSLTSHPDKIV